MKSCIYEGRVRHRRNYPTLHQFDFRTFMLMLDLDELPTVFAKRWLWSAKKMAFARLRQSDRLKSHGHLDSMRQRVSAILAENGISQELSSVRLLTQVRYLGFEMNPVCFYYCFSHCLPEDTDESSETQEGDPLVLSQQPERIIAIIAEVNNTPWGEQHNYVIGAEQAGGKPRSERTSVRSLPISKTFHVSPFLDMNMDYRMAFSVPGQKLGVKIENHLHPVDNDAKDLVDEADSAKEKILDVTMLLERTPITGTNLNWMLVKYPLISFKIFAGIYWQALRLYLKKVPFFPHPKNQPDAELAGSKPESNAGANGSSTSAWVGR